MNQRYKYRVEGHARIGDPNQQVAGDYIASNRKQLVDLLMKANIFPTSIRCLGRTKQELSDI